MKIRCYGGELNGQVVEVAVTKHGFPVKCKYRNSTGKEDLYVPRAFLRGDTKYAILVLSTIELTDKVMKQLVSEIGKSPDYGIWGGV